METMDRIDGIDLALMGALDALLTERHVTRAAQRLGITQSSMSHHLGRLREALGDPLLVRVGRAMVLTPRAEAMAAPLRGALAELRRVVAEAGAFDARTATRSFTVACPDLLAPVIPELLAAVTAEAPGVRLRVVTAAGELPALLAGGGCDLALGASPDEAPGVVRRSLGAVGWCVLARKGHPVTRGRFTAAAWGRYPHVVVGTGSAAPNRVGAAIERAGVTRTVGVTVPTFLAAPWVVARSEMLFTAPRALVTEVAEALGLAVLTTPVELPTIGVAALWHERMQADAGHRWFRERLVGALEKRLAKPRSRR